MEKDTIFNRLRPKNASFACQQKIRHHISKYTKKNDRLIEKSCLNKCRKHVTNSTIFHEKKKSQQTCNRRELLRWSKGHLQMQNKAETAHSELPIAELPSYTIPGKGSALHLSELNFCKEQKSCRLCVCVYTHVCENVHACTRQKSSVIIFFDCFPFYI